MPIQSMLTPEAQPTQHIPVTSASILTSSNIPPVNDLLNVKNIYGNATPITLEIQTLGKPDPSASGHVHPCGDSLFGLCQNKFENITAKELISGSTGNAFFDFLYLAWIHHSEIVLSPDDIWQQIAMETAVFIDKEAERLREYNVSHTGKKQLIVNTDASDAFNDWSSPKYRWDAIIGEMCNLIKSDMKTDLATPFIEPFSTSTLIEKAASQICLMHSCQKYYEYSQQMLICGIEKVHYLGKQSDWDLLEKKIAYLKDYASKTNSECLYYYLSRLIPIVHSIAEGYNKKLDLKFWNSIFIENHVVAQFYGGYTGKELNGWATKFILYNRKGKTTIMDLDDVGTRYCKAPLKIKVEGSSFEKNVMFLTGFSKVAREGKCYRPVMCVGVTDKNDEIESKLSYFEWIDH